MTPRSSLRTSPRAAAAISLAICVALLLIPAPASADRTSKVRLTPAKTLTLRPTHSKPEPRRAATKVVEPTRRRAPDLSGRVRVLGSPRDDTSARLHLIEGAKKSLQMNTFQLANDRVGWMLAAKLIQAARRGVEVEFVADAMGSRGAEPVLDAMAKGGVRVAVYNQLDLRHPAKATKRLHDKLIIADGKRMMVGARNMANGYYHLRNAHGGSSNTDTYVEGRSAKGASRYFSALWSGKLVQQVRPTGSMSATQADRLAHADKVWARISPRLARHFETLPEHRVEKVRFVHDSPNTFSKKSGTRTSFYAFLRVAKKSVTVHTPYVVPTRQFLAEVEAAVKRGVKVKIVTNSWNTRDGLLAQLGFEARLHRLAATGAEIWQYRGKNSMHSKTIVTDDRHTFIGSFNVDPRSERLNKEVGTVIRSKAVAERTRKLAREHERKSVKVAGGGAIISATRKSITPRAVRFGSRWLVGPLLRASGVYDQL